MWSCVLLYFFQVHILCYDVPSLFWSFKLLIHITLLTTPRLPFVCLSVHWELRCGSASPYLYTQCTEPSVQIGTLPCCTMPLALRNISHLCRPLDFLYKHKIRRKNKPRLEGLSLFQQKALSPGLGPTLNCTHNMLVSEMTYNLGIWYLDNPPPKNTHFLFKNKSNLYNYRKICYQCL